LLFGRSEKEVALILGLSRHTVHEHVKAIYRAYGVRSRAELMSLLLRAQERRELQEPAA
jgi:DNA-binding CsgD family transcriptional regulator